jgi:hypothetical protein
MQIEILGTRSAYQHLHVVYGTGSREEVLRNRPAALVRIYELIEAYAKTLATLCTF